MSHLNGGYQTAGPRWECGEKDHASDALKIAWVGEAPTLDIHHATTTSTRRLAWHMFERLFTFDKPCNLVPALAEGYDVFPDGKPYTVRIRKGVLFRNGEAMTPEDVIASFKRWMDDDPIRKNYLIPDRVFTQSSVLATQWPGYRSSGANGAHSPLRGTV